MDDVLTLLLAPADREAIGSAADLTILDILLGFTATGVYENRVGLKTEGACKKDVHNKPYLSRTLNLYQSQLGQPCDGFCNGLIFDKRLALDIRNTATALLLNKSQYLLALCRA